jgi:L-aminopeptidase/D-esterase-like protein
MAVNAVGDVRDPESGELIAGVRDANDGRRLLDTARAMRVGARPLGFRAPHTTIGVVATNGRLTKAEAAVVAELGMIGFARALSPPHLGTDGDTLIALSVGDAPADISAIGLAAAEAVGHAIARAIRAATSLPSIPAARDLR